MNYTPKDKERISVYRNLFAYVVRSFYEEVDIVVMDSVLYHYFTHFIFETKMVVQATNLPREMVSKSLTSFNSGSLIRQLFVNQSERPSRKWASFFTALHSRKLRQFRRKRNWAVGIKWEYSQFGIIQSGENRKEYRIWVQSSLNRISMNLPRNAPVIIVGKNFGQKSVTVWRISVFVGRLWN